MRDTPRIRLYETKDKNMGLMRRSEVNSLVMIAREHNREPGAFDYNFPQYFYSTYNDIDQETYVTWGSDQKRRVHTD